MSYIAGCRIHLPFTEVTKEKGDKITKKELADANQEEENIQALIEGGSLLTEEQYQELLAQEKADEDKARAASLRAEADALEKGGE